MILEKTKIGTRLNIGFWFIIILTALTSLLAGSHIKSLSATIDNLYNRPFAISTAVLRIDSNIGHLNQTMKEVLLATTPEDIQRLEGRVAELKKEIDKDFDIATKRAESEDVLIEKTRRLFREWLSIQGEVTAAMLSGKSNVAWNTSEGPGAEKLVALRTSVSELITASDAIAFSFIENAKRNSDKAMALIVAMAILALVLGTAIAYLITRSITRPLENALEISNRLANGDLTVETDTSRSDEFGQLLRAMADMVGKLREVIYGVALTAENVATISQRLDRSSQEISRGASDQASSVDAIVVSMEEMNSIILTNNDNAMQTDVIASKAADNAQSGGENIIRVINSIKDIAKSIQIIDEISEQTNLLAINAEIEAARAGHAGSGFSVVASEVRKLAERSQESTTSISKVTKSTERDAENSREMLEKMISDILETARLIQQISSANKDQRESVTQVDTAIRNLGHIVQKYLSGAEEMASHSRELSVEAQQLQNSVEFFKLR
jgi:methyl-accepting chemotaxis protein